MWVGNVLLLLEMPILNIEYSVLALSPFWCFAFLLNRNVFLSHARVVDFIYTITPNLWGEFSMSDWTNSGIYFHVQFLKKITYKTPDNAVHHLATVLILWKGD